MAQTSIAVSKTAPAPSRDEAGGGRQYLAYTLEGELFAIDILRIREIIEFGVLTEVPMMPPTVRGVINLRGAVVPVIDLAARFGRAGTRVGRRTCIVIVEIAGVDETQILGVLVDAVNEVMEIPARDIERAPAFGARIRTDFIAGMGRVDGRFVIILDVDKVLSANEIAEIDALTGAP